MQDDIRELIEAYDDYMKRRPLHALTADERFWAAMFRLRRHIGPKPRNFTIRELIDVCSGMGGQIILPAGEYGLDDPLPDGVGIKVRLPPEGRGK